MTEQYIRQLSLIVSDSNGNGLELNQFAVRFNVQHNTFSIPHIANIRIYNLKPETVSRIGTEFNNISIQAGYIGNFGLIFQGSIKQVRFGRESATDSFVDIHAADGDQYHNWGVVNGTLPNGYTQAQVWQTLGTNPLNNPNSQISLNVPTTPAPTTATAPLTSQPQASPAPRGKVMFGLARDYIRDWANTNQQTVTWDNGQLKALPLLSYKQGQPIEINVTSGMVGVPEQTEAGITATVLLNPALAWGSLVHINNADIAQNLRSAFGGAEEYKKMVISGGQDVPLPTFFPDVTADGYYKVLAVDHTGETRGQTWYSTIICLGIDPAAAAHITDPIIGLNVGLLKSTAIPPG